MDHEQSSRLGRAVDLRLVGARRTLRLIPFSRMPMESPMSLRHLLAVVMAVVVAVGLASSASAHGTPPEIEVQALVRDVEAPLLIEYVVIVTYEDGDPTEAEIVFEADSEGRYDFIDSGTADELGQARFSVEFPDDGVWYMRVRATNDFGDTTVEFTETAPWPDYLDEVGRPKVRVDTVDSSREGLLLDPVDADAPSGELFADTEDFGTVETAGRSGAEATLHPDGGLGTTSVHRRIPFSVIRNPVLLRLAHLGAIGLWLFASLSPAAGSARRRAKLASAGIVSTLLTGAALAAWSAPLTYPGLFDLDAVLDLHLGGTYVAALGLKLAAVAGAIALTLRPQARERKLFVGCVAIAVVAVTVMTQAHVVMH